MCTNVSRPNFFFFCKIKPFTKRTILFIKSFKSKKKYFTQHQNISNCGWQLWFTNTSLPERNACLNTNMELCPKKVANICKKKSVHEWKNNMYRPYCIQLIDLTYMTLLSLNTVCPKSLDQGRHQRVGKWTRAYPWCSKNRALGWNKEIKVRQNSAQILLAIRDSTFCLPYLKSWGRPWPWTILNLSYKMNQDFLDTLYRSK